MTRPVPARKRITIPWTPLAVTAVVLLSSAFAVQPVRDAATLADVAEAYLVRPVSYVALAPLSNVLDTLTLLSVRQHIALVVGLIVLFSAWRIVRSVRGTSSGRSHLLASLSLIVALLLAYVAAALLPRPMASLVSDNANILIADFHSHTSTSHDVRGGWSAERNRAWHRAGGYDLAYVTDHGGVAGAERGMANNPNPAADGVTLLQGIEATWSGEHVTILNAERTYKGLLTANLRDVDEQAFRLASLIGGREPVVIWNHARDLSKLPPNAPDAPGVRAIELVNGSPPGMDAIRPKRDAILALATRHNLALTAGSDNHGWGRTAPAWTLLRVFGWRGSQGDALALEIERALRVSGIRGTRVVERRVADPGGRSMGMALTIFAVPLRMLTTLSNEERVVWIVWIWIVAAGAWWVRRRRDPQPA
jgi:hypothetical protein